MNVTPSVESEVVSVQGYEEEGRKRLKSMVGESFERHKLECITMYICAYLMRERNRRRGIQTLNQHCVYLIGVPSSEVIILGVMYLSSLSLPSCHYLFQFSMPTLDFSSSSLLLLFSLLPVLSFLLLHHYCHFILFHILWISLAFKRYN